ncbi:hypothetical protein MTO96_008184 [Rhipicephalus appendiculatus]
MFAGEPEPERVAVLPRGVSGSLGKVVGAAPLGACSRLSPGASASSPHLREVAVESASSSSVIAGTGTKEESSAQAGEGAAGAVDLEAVRDASKALVLSQFPITWTACFSISCCDPLTSDVGRAFASSEL